MTSHSISLAPKPVSRERQRSTNSTSTTQGHLPTFHVRYTLFFLELCLTLLCCYSLCQVVYISFVSINFFPQLPLELQIFSRKTHSLPLSTDYHTMTRKDKSNQKEEKVTKKGDANLEVCGIFLPPERDPMRYNAFRSCVTG